MTKSAYIGINDVAKEIEHMYIGIDNVAKKVKKAYIGDINGVAQLIYSEKEEINTISYPWNDTVYLYNILQILQSAQYQQNQNIN